MRFLIDAHLPRRLVILLASAGHDAIHTLDLPDGNKTTDVFILKVAAQEQRVVVTKDADFVNSYQVKQQPERLLLISTGNITNAALEALLVPGLPSIVSAFSTAHFLELSKTALIIHS